MPQSFGCEVLPGQHSTDFSRSSFSGQLIYGGNCSPFYFFLLDDKVMIGESRDLREVRHAQDLVPLGESLQAAADTLCRYAADPGVHLIKDERPAF